MRATNSLNESIERHAAPPVPAVGTAAVIEIFDRPEDLAAIWDALFERCRASPYQSRAWQSAYAAHALAPGERAHVALVREPVCGRPVMLLPLVTSRRGMVTVGSSIGGKHANFHMPITCAEAPALAEPAAMRAHLTEIARRLGIDVFVVRHLPVQWNGRANPLALPEAQESASHAYWTSLAGLAPDEPTVALGKDTRKKLRRKREWLAELGPVRLVRETHEDEIDRVLEVFFAQKAARMREMGIANPFDEPAARAFLHAATRPDEAGRAAVGIWSLRAGDRIVATFGAALDRERVSGMFISFDASPEIARSSPGDLLVQSLLDALRAEGVRSFDLGVGAARYKNQFCDRREPLVDLVLPVTLRGRLYALTARLYGRAKRWAKNTPRVMDALARVRRTAGSLTPPR